jgi:hypothetical protein
VTLAGRLRAPTSRARFTPTTVTPKGFPITTAADQHAPNESWPIPDSASTQTAMRDSGLVNQQRGLVDDLKWALAVMTGVAMGALVFGADASLLGGAAIGVALVVAVRAMLRHRRRRSRR